MSIWERLRGNPDIIKPIENRRILGISLVLVALVCFTGIDTAAKWLIGHGMPTQEVVFTRYGLQLAFVLLFLLPLHGKKLLVTRRPGLEIARGVTLLGATTLNFMALRYLPLTVTGAIAFTVPLAVCALSVPLLGERVGWQRWGAVIVGFAGVLIIVRPGAETFNWATLLSLGMALSLALYNILTRKLAGVDSAYTQQFYAALVATVFVAPFAIGGWVWPLDLAGWVAFVSLGVLATIGHLIFTIAHRLAPASSLVPFIYTQILAMSAASWLVFGEAPDIWIYLGVPVVIASGLFIWFRERRQDQAGGQ